MEYYKDELYHWVHAQHMQGHDCNAHFWRIERGGAVAKKKQDYLKRSQKSGV